VFEALGLTSTESAVYAALVSNPRSSPTELAEHAAISAQQAAGAAHRLVRRGLANRLPGAQIRFMAVAPDVAVDPLIARQEDQLQQAKRSSHELMTAFRESSRHTHPDELVEIITGPVNIASRMRQFHDTVRHEIKGFDRPPYAGDFSPPALEVRRLGEGISYRVVYTPEAVMWPGRADGDIREVCERGEQARVRPHLPVKLVIVDDRLAFVPVKTSQHRVDTALMIHPCDLLDALSALFESEWNQAISLRSYLSEGDPAPKGDGPGEGMAALLLGLAAGLTDDGLARAMDSSLRTTQRHIQRLMRDLNATTRFQAGLEARERGWA
jgi:hypothetical protein